MEHHLEENDDEVSAAFGVAGSGTANVKQATTPQYTIIDMDRSDDEESDHTPDPYTQHMRGRVSPSPYTANTERARQFNAYVRGIIEQKLDVLIPISHQPRDLISEIITDASNKFPEFSTCVRKRIRTYLKSYRRSKKIKEAVGTNGVGMRLDDIVPGVTAVLPASIAQTLIQQHNSTDVQQPSSGVGTAVVTIIADSPQPTITDDQPPEPKRIKISPPQPAARVSGAPIIPQAGQTLSTSEVTAVRQLITGYRESAAFLQRAADQLEAMLTKESS